ncbi:hypothetical protein SAMN06265182_0767 [Persephonella hydrogeniphila]|uniref:Uncharacterized protein n=1 Tax=Persephonella hydrogeniphila TaxID=198703 RepID=A0A285NB96_9AQUI|nr:hypothetical protein [Persephonella hydrogeniphila]SNZ06699.1 hypothetical protein SAMN06265182_0767 [Persephonella hydrogeniphila]
MEKITKFLKKISEENSYHFFIYEKTGEIWISGYRNSTKFDLVLKPIKKHQIKLIYETPDERKVALFLNKTDAYKRLKKIFSQEEHKNSEETVQSV